MLKKAVKYSLCFPKAVTRESISRCELGWSGKEWKQPGELVSSWICIWLVPKSTREHKGKAEWDCYSWCLWYICHLSVRCCCAAGSNQMATMPDGIFHKMRVSCLWTNGQQKRRVCYHSWAWKSVTNIKLKIKQLRSKFSNSKRSIQPGKRKDGAHSKWFLISVDVLQPTFGRRIRNPFLCVALERHQLT